jgi:hypothetical protein
MLPAALLSGKVRYPLYQRWFESRRRSLSAWKTSPSPSFFNSRSVAILTTLFRQSSSTTTTTTTSSSSSRHRRRRHEIKTHFMCKLVMLNVFIEEGKTAFT